MIFYIHFNENIVTIHVLESGYESISHKCLLSYSISPFVFEHAYATIYIRLISYKATCTYHIL